MNTDDFEIDFFGDGPGGSTLSASLPAKPVQEEVGLAGNRRVS